MSDDRSERLRQTRNRAKERGRKEENEEGDSSPSAEASKPDKQSEPSKPDEPSETSVNDERVGTYMYLPESQQKELSRLYNVLKAEYEYEHDVEFEKNRHFYPLVIEYGIDGLDSLDASDIKERLDSLDL
jgi:hypothetical protein